MPPANTSLAHVAHVPARLQATWAEVVLAGGLRYQKIIGWELLLMLQLKFSERLMQFGDIVPTPTGHATSGCEDVLRLFGHLVQR